MLKALKQPKRHIYQGYTVDYKAKIAKYALENDKCAAARKYYNSSEPKKSLNKSTVCSWVTKYKEKWTKKRA